MHVIDYLGSPGGTSVIGSACNDAARDNPPYTLVAEDQRASHRALAGVEVQIAATQRNRLDRDNNLVGGWCRGRHPLDSEIARPAQDRRAHRRRNQRPRDHRYPHSLHTRHIPQPTAL